MLVSLFRSKGVSFFPRGSSSLFSARLWVRVKDSLDPVSLARLWGGRFARKSERKAKERKKNFLSLFSLPRTFALFQSLSLSNSFSKRKAETQIIQRERVKRRKQKTEKSREN